MAPLSSYTAYGISGAVLGSRAADTIVPTGSNSFTSSQRNTLQCVALVFSTISVASAILAFYWFVRMRRSFRHDLIMLLIQSDMFKALWFMVYPIVAYAHGPVLNDSVFCQVNGFFLAIGIEASGWVLLAFHLAEANQLLDIAVTMIAIHSALYIIKPRTGEGGLYPHRHIAYTIWALLPITMASLAFVRSDRPYVAEGAYCYLPLRPLWYPLALSWAPRYLIFIIIIVLYASIYWYVRYKFSGFTKVSKRISIPPRDQHSTTSKDSTPSPPAPLTGQEQTPNSRQIFGTESDRSIESSYGQVPISPEPQALRFMWTSVVSAGTSSQTESTLSNSQQIMTAQSLDYFSNRSSTQPLVDNTSTLASGQGQSPQLPVEPDQAHLGPQHSQNSNPLGIDIFTLLNQRPEEEDEEDDEPAPLALQLVNSRGHNVTVSEMIHTRNKIRRQLRHLFIYPLVYIGMWLVPLICQILQFDDRFAVNLPFGLRCVSTICLYSQAAIECWLFSSREKPWKHIPNTDGSFSSSLKFWVAGDSNEHAGEVKAARRLGRTKDEVVREVRAAYQRRNEEIAERRSESEQPRPFNLRGDRMWWDAAGMETTMTPVFEEPVNPMDSILTTGSPPPTMEPLPRSIDIRTIKGRLT